MNILIITKDNEDRSKFISQNNNIFVRSMLSGLKSIQADVLLLGKGVNEE